MCTDNAEDRYYGNGRTKRVRDAAKAVSSDTWDDDKSTEPTEPLSEKDEVKMLVLNICTAMIMIGLAAVFLVGCFWVADQIWKAA